MKVRCICIAIKTTKRLVAIGVRYSPKRMYVEFIALQTVIGIIRMLITATLLHTALYISDTLSLLA